LDNANKTVHNLNAGQMLTETFAYYVVDDGGFTSSAATLTITITGTTDTGTCTGIWCEVTP
jgi:VCBS repeat-containing protein